jgi:hypothetical protein
VIRGNGGHFVRIHRTAQERWLEQFALASNRGPLRRRPASSISMSAAGVGSLTG